MANYQLFTTADHVELLDKLQGSLRLEADFPPAGLPLGGLTLVFTAPTAVTVTFPGAAGALVTATAALAAILAAVTGLNGTLRTEQGGRDQSVTPSGRSQFIVLKHDTAIAIANTGTANSLFKLSTSVATTSAPVPQTKIVATGVENLTHRWYLIIAP